MPSVSRLTSFGSIFALLILLLWHSWFGPDVWYHLSWGRDLVEELRYTPVQRTLLMQPLSGNVYWLFQTLLFATYKAGGIHIVSVLFAGIWLVIAGIWIYLSGAWQKPIAGPLMFLAFVICCQLRFEHRPEIFSYLYLMGTLWWFTAVRGRETGWRPLAALFLLQAIWSNTHSYFALGPLIAGASLFDRESERRTAWKALMCTVIASLVAPTIGLHWVSVWQYSRVASGLRDLNAELFPPALWPPFAPVTVFWLYWCMCVALSMRALWLRRDVFAALVALGGAILAVQAQRNIPLIVFMSAPLLGAVAEPHSRLFWRRLIGFGTAGGAAVLAVIVITGSYHRFLGSLSTFGVRLESASYPIGATEFLRNAGFKGRIFTDSYDGGYVEFHLPQAQVAGDSYFSDAAMTREFFAAIRDPAALWRLDQRFSFDGLLLNIENLEVVDAVLTRPDWLLVYCDTHRALFFRNGKTDKPVIHLASATYYSGENLRDWAYAFGPISWMAIARKHRDRNLLMKILSDVSAAPHIPSTLVKMALGYAIDNYDREIVAMVEPLKIKIYEAEGGDLEKLADLEIRARRCCQ